MIDIVCLIGPTGSGKTAASLALADKYNIGIVNFDSRQVYRDLPVITAQPTFDEQMVCPHKLYGFLPSRFHLMAALFAKIATKAINSHVRAGRLPVLVGGTGFYLRTLLEGLSPIDDIKPEVRQQVQEDCRKYGPGKLHIQLQSLDPDYADKIHPNDTQRNCRAMEVCISTGRNMTWWHSRKPAPSPFNPLKIVVFQDLDILTPRLGQRIDQMLDQGALKEMERAYERCPDRSAPAFTGIGCPELLAVLFGEKTLAEASLLWRQNTRAYAKRQLTWFKKEKDVHWIESGHEKQVVDLVASFAEAEFAG